MELKTVDGERPPGRLVSRVRPDRELFLELTNEGLGGGLPLFDVADGKVPQVGVVGPVGSAMTEQQSTVFLSRPPPPGPAGRSPCDHARQRYSSPERYLSPESTATVTTV